MFDAFIMTNNFGEDQRYLDIGIIDTVKDLFVNLIGAIVFSMLGYLYARLSICSA
ncbi:hypothetical protein GCM10010978_33210 [Compostibacillus humi]|uniref:Uncharacterized protein n=1 Tax=Compostibacillus humi TaxID=1245525 RepID=A0A8J2TU56_9BACI|nr:hypothetical protein GCM10010978_33210 [Compostibacillus humi]